jgi:hypothetical protein
VYKIRHWSVSNSKKLESFYNIFEPLMVKLHPLWNTIGYGLMEKPVRLVEKAVKGLMFDCQMCGHCVLSSTGMSCPMNCPKSIRNGPCGGVRLDGNCEIKPEMRCVWVEAWRGSQQMKKSGSIREQQIPVNFTYKGSSSWMRVVKNEVQKHQEEVAL